MSKPTHSRYISDFYAPDGLGEVVGEFPSTKEKRTFHFPAWRGRENPSKSVTMFSPLA